jgi:hypothetical protein
MHAPLLQYCEAPASSRHHAPTHKQHKQQEGSMQLGLVRGAASKKKHAAE